MVEIKIEIGQDYICIEDGKRVPRPVHISRVRWRAFWMMIAVQGINKRTNMVVKKFMETRYREPFGS
jgi:hypothetical protein